MKDINVNVHDAVDAVGVHPTVNSTVTGGLGVAYRTFPRETLSIWKLSPARTLV